MKVSLYLPGNLFPSFFRDKERKESDGMVKGNCKRLGHRTAKVNAPILAKKLNKK
jgi:hypothetical protein